MEEVYKLSKSSTQSIDILAVEGNAVDAIIYQAKKYDDVILVVGMKGEGKNIRKLFGSVASGSARKSFLPLVIVPEGVVFNGFKNIAMAVDDGVTIDLHGLTLIHRMGKIFGSKTYIVRALKYGENIINELSLRFHALSGKLFPLEVEFDFPRGNEVSLTIFNYCKEKKVDLLILFPHYHSNFERLFFRGETRKMIFESQFPLFLLPDEKVERKSIFKKSEKQKL